MTFCFFPSCICQENYCCGLGVPIKFRELGIFMLLLVPFLFLGSGGGDEVFASRKYKMLLLCTDSWCKDVSCQLKTRMNGNVLLLACLRTRTHRYSLFLVWATEEESYSRWNSNAETENKINHSFNFCSADFLDKSMHVGGKKMKKNK